MILTQIMLNIDLEQLHGGNIQRDKELPSGFSISFSNSSEFFAECGFLKIKQGSHVLLIPGGKLRLLGKESPSDTWISRALGQHSALFYQKVSFLHSWQNVTIYEINTHDYAHEEKH